MFLQRLYVGRSKETYIGGYTFNIKLKNGFTIIKTHCFNLSRDGSSLWISLSEILRSEQSDVWASSSQAPLPPHTLLLFSQPLFSTDNISDFLAQGL